MVSGIEEGECPHGKPGMKILGIFIGYTCSECTSIADVAVSVMVNTLDLDKGDLDFDTKGN